MSGEDGSLGEIRKALAGITRRLDALADAVGVAAASAPPGALLDEPARARLAGLESLLAVGRGTTAAEACLLAVDRAITHARADCAAILERTDGGTLPILAQRGFRRALEARVDEGIVGRAVQTAEVVQAGLGLGGPDGLLDAHGLGAALAVPILDGAGGVVGALLAGRRRGVAFEPDAVGSLVMVADRVAAALRVQPIGVPAPPSERSPSALFASLDLGRTAREVAAAAATHLGADAAAVLLPAGEGLLLAGGVGLPDEARAPGPGAVLATATATGRPWTPAPDEPADPGLILCLGATPRLLVPLALPDGLVALIAVGSRTACRTALPAAFAEDAALAIRNARLHTESLRAVADVRPAPAAAPDLGRPPLGDMAGLLAVILGRLATVRDRVADPAAARDLAEAEEAAWRVAEAVRRVLGFASGPDPHAAVPLDLAALVRETARAAEALWAREGAALAVALDLGAAPPIKGYPDELHQALHHLLTNAREAGDDRHPVTVRLRWDGGTGVELAVIDAGRGMDAATRARAGEPFFTTKGPGRLGIGLAVVQAVAARHHGAVDVESAPDRGTTVRLRLPTASGSPPSAGPRGDSAPGPPARLLLVEDEQPVRETLVRGLARGGYAVRDAGDVGDAVALLGREAFDLVITDLVLPGGSGLEVARTSKRAHPGVPVILVTGWPGRVDRETLDSHGIDAVVEKPVGLDTLRATVARLIERAAAQRG
ncbi:MAG TPA: ATP-binding protein [Methylomirabilota bacterium]